MTQTAAGERADVAARQEIAQTLDAAYGAQEKARKLAQDEQRAEWMRQVGGRAATARATLTHDQQRAMTFTGVALVLATIGPALVVNRFWVGESASKLLGIGQGTWGTAAFAAAVGSLFIALYYFQKARRDEQDISDLEFEHDLLRYDVKPFESRAEKLLSVNQIQLRRYYELNLQQARAVFVVGISCLGVGILIVGATFGIVYLLGRQGQFADGTTKIIVAGVGAVGTIMTNYVAAMYLKMHSAIATSLTRFHAELSATQGLFFANVLASGVDDDRQRRKTLVRIALAIATRASEASASALAAKPVPPA